MPPPLKVSLCTPSENTPTESLARLVSMVFQWFHSTAYMMDDEVGSLVEKLKPQFVTKWLKTVCDVRFDVMVMCLLPKPVEFARVRRSGEGEGVLECKGGSGSVREGL